MIKRLRLPLDVQRLILLELGAGRRRRLEEYHQDQTQPRTLINLSLVCRDWKDIV
ncbi:hypothetical protein BDY24DRAFT_413307 [Mrakia frigida]|uniref:uncharacterized protein n=1 Tax=Mrakia frigida TaxID=29902 RepID=UPI003FCC1ACA